MGGAGLVPRLKPNRQKNKMIIAHLYDKLQCAIHDSFFLFFCLGGGGGGGGGNHMMVTCIET